MLWYSKYKTKYEDLLTNRVFKALDLIEDYLYEKDLETQEIKRLVKIYLALDTEAVERLIYTHEYMLKDKDSDYKNTNLCKRRNVYVPIFKKELKKFKKKDS